MAVSNNYRHPVPWDTRFDDTTLPAMFAASVEAHPDAPLVDFLGRRYSYADLHAEARAFAAGLQSRGVGKGDRVGLFLPNVPAYISAYYGAMLAGATVVNFSPLYSAEELAAQVEDSGTRILVTLDARELLSTALVVLDASSLETLVVAELGHFLSAPKRLALKLLGRKKIRPVPVRGGVGRWTDWLEDAPPRIVEIAPGDVALLQYTGGTTGVPKGAMLTHANLAANARQVEAIDPFDDSVPDMILGVLPLFHVFANTCVLNRTVAKGGCIAMLPRFDAKQALATLERVKATALPGVPTMFQAMLDSPHAAKTDFGSLRICIAGGAPLPAPLKRRFERATGAKLVEGYGLTESSGVVSANPYEGGEKPGTIGQPLPGTEVRLLDKENPQRKARKGTPGELAIKGPQIMKGYWGRADADAEVFVDGWLRTGDVATEDEDGFLSIVDRIKDMIAVGGFKVFPSHVEDVLLEHEAIREVLVIGMPDELMGEVPRAYVTLAEDAEVSEEALAVWLNPKVGKHERVDRVVIREELPKTMIGKLDRKTLRAEVIGN